MNQVCRGKVPHEAHQCLEMIRHDAHEGDVLGAVGYFLGIVSDHQLTLEEAGTTRQELASLIRFGLLNQAIAHLENAKTLEIGYQTTTSSEQVDEALRMAARASRLSDEAREAHERMEVLAAFLAQAEALLEKIEQDNRFLAAADADDEVSGVHAIPTEPPPAKAEDVSACLNEGCTHENIKTCVVALKREEERVRNLPDDVKAEMARASCTGLAENDPFIRAEKMRERGDTTVQFRRIGSGCVENLLDAKFAAEDAAMLAPAIPVRDDETVELSSEELVTIPPPAFAQRLSEPPPLPSQRPQTAEG